MTKTLAIRGYSNSGKTSLVKELIRELKELGYSVSTIKSMQSDHPEGTPHQVYTNFKKDSDSYIHSEAGSEMVTIWTGDEVSFNINKSLTLDEILAWHTSDYVLVEGGKSLTITNIVVARCNQDLIKLVNEGTVGLYLTHGFKKSDLDQTFLTFPVYEGDKQINDLLDYIVEDL